MEPVAKTVNKQVTLDNYRVVAVRPDWTDSRGLLGYYNPITGRYRATPFLRLLRRAQEEVDAATIEGRDPVPFFLVLDEMNLARVEHYFADFLSALESGEPISLHDVDELELGTDEEAGAIPKTIAVPANLFFVGTVNVDESTYMFSLKVLDRAFTIELNDVHLDTFGTASEWSEALNLVGWDGRLSPSGTRKPATADWIEFGALADGELRNQVLGIHRILCKRNRHFGYRVANEIARFVNLAVAQASDPEQVGWVALDLAILQKVLVKLNGTQQELDELLGLLLQFCLNGSESAAGLPAPSAWLLADDGRALVAGDYEGEPVFPRSALKVWRMRKRLEERGFTAWIE